MIDNLTILLTYYESPNMLCKQLDTWKQYSAPLQDRVRVIVVDDGSPKHPALDVLNTASLPLMIELYRIEKNIPWNSAGARNLGMQHVHEGWVLATDIDLVLVDDCAESLLSLDLDPEVIYYLRRKNYRDGQWYEINYHVETFLMTKHMFWARVKGYDNALSGWWNGAWTPFRKQCKRVAKEEILLDEYLLNYTDLIEDATVSQWGRRDSRYDINRKEDMKQQQRKQNRNYKPVTPITFPWQRQL